MSSWDQANRGEQCGLVWRNRKKISQIINDYLYLPFFLLIILWPWTPNAENAKRWEYQTTPSCFLQASKFFFFFSCQEVTWHLVATFSLLPFLLVSYYAVTPSGSFTAAQYKQSDLNKCARPQIANPQFFWLICKLQFCNFSLLFKYAYCKFANFSP